MTPIQVTEVMDFIPHRPPMVWVDEVLRFSQIDGECTLRLRQGGLYLGERGLRPSSCLELIAQSYGFISTCYITRISDPGAPPMKRAMLVSFKDAKFAPRAIFESLRLGDVLRMPIEGVRTVGPITAFHGRALRGDDLLCDVQMRTFCE